MNELFMTYLDFELEIGPGLRREYPVAVTQSPAGEAQATMQLPYDELGMEKRLTVLQNALLGPETGPSPFPTPEEMVVRNFGRDLFAALFTGGVRRCYEGSLQQAWRESKGIRVRLRIQPSDLAALPWEFLYDPRQDEYICLSRDTSLVRYLAPPRTVPPLGLSPPLRILGVIVGAEDPDSPDGAPEKEAVETALHGLQARGLVELTWLEGGSRRHLYEAMGSGEWHVCHFLGQGGSGGDRVSDKGLMAPAGGASETRRLSAGDLVRPLAEHRSLRVAVLNAREGVPKGQLRNTFTNTAELMVRQGIPAVLAVPYKIREEAAVELFRVFYEALALGRPIDAALADARQAVSIEVANTVEFGAPALFTGLPDGLVFVPPGALEPEQAAVVSDQAEGDSDIGKAAVASGIGAVAAASAQADAPDRSEAEEPALTIVEPEEPPEEVPELEPEPESPPEEPEQEAEEPRREPELVALARAPQPVEPEMVLIPAGEFLMGSDPEKDQRAYDAEQPQHRVYLPDYHIARTPVTNAQYAAFVEASGSKAPKYWVEGRPPSGKEDYPVAYVSWRDAMAYCRWLSQKKGQTFRLPSEAEWEKAARGTGGGIYPWGDTWEVGRCNSKKSGPDDTTLVDAHPDGASPFGVLDMAGNVWEWTLSLYKPYPYDSKDGREARRGIGKRVLRGGAYYSTARRVRCAYRDSGNADDCLGSYGFRVVLTP